MFNIKDSTFIFLAPTMAESPLKVQVLVSQFSLCPLDKPNMPFADFCHRKSTNPGQVLTFKSITLV